MNLNFAPSQKAASWKKSLLIWCAGISLAFLIGAVLVKLLVTSDGERIQTLHDFASSPWLIVFRVTVYAGLWFYWSELLKLFLGQYRPTLVTVTRRPLLILLMGYELLFASDLLGYLV